jgi:hypothetical protein
MLEVFDTWQDAIHKLANGGFGSSELIFRGINPLQKWTYLNTKNNNLFAVIVIFEIIIISLIKYTFAQKLITKYYM